MDTVDIAVDRGVSSKAKHEARCDPRAGGH
jgi:hypothetical protein